jgi:hypothetical protein
MGGHNLDNADLHGHRVRQNIIESIASTAASIVSTATSIVIGVIELA